MKSTGCGGERAVEVDAGCDLRSDLTRDGRQSRFRSSELRLVGFLGAGLAGGGLTVLHGEENRI